MSAPNSKNPTSSDISRAGVIYAERRPAKRPNGDVVPGPFNRLDHADNLSQFNSYTTDMVKGVIRAFRARRNDRAVWWRWSSPAPATSLLHRRQHQKYAEYYAGSRREYRRYAPVQRHGLGHPPA